VRIANWKEFYAGSLYGLIGLATLWIGRGYEVGSARAMGPGYLLRVLAGALIVIALICLFRSVTTGPQHLTATPWRALLLILAALLYFSVALKVLGLFPVTLGAYLIAFSASRNSAFDPQSLGIAFVFAVLCSALFKFGLALPVPLLPVLI
jgi:hypothetical protein